jgi:hypothetical protein
MEYHARKCERCEEFDPITIEIPLHYTRRESTIDFEDARCDRCLFELDRQLFDVQEIIKTWNITCEHDKCTEPANFYNCGRKFVCCLCYVRTYCHIHCRVCNIAHKCRDDDCIKTLAKANKMCYY